MHRVFWHIESLDFDIYWSGFMIMVGFMLAIWVASRRSRVIGVDPFFTIDITVFLLLSGVAGARLMFVLHYWDTLWLEDRGFFANLGGLVNIRDGGLEFYGGLLLAVPVGILYLRLKKVPLVPFMDLALPTVALGLAFGRIGCFLNGCCYGKIVDATHGVSRLIAVSYPQFDTSGKESIPYSSHLRDGLVPRGEEQGFAPAWEVTRELIEKGWLTTEHYKIGEHISTCTAPLMPSQLVSSFANILVFLFLGWMWYRAYSPARHREPQASTRRRPRYGEIAALFGICYALTRFGLELLRQDTAPVVFAGVPLFGKHGLTISQVISIGIFSVSAPLFILLRRGIIGRPIEPLPEEEAS